MTNKLPPQGYEMGMVGLGVMGRNLVLNMADPDCSVADYGFEALSVGEK
jgi:6-phosphogluconate dehydrogenase